MVLPFFTVCCSFALTLFRDGGVGNCYVYVLFTLIARSRNIKNFPLLVFFAAPFPPNVAVYNCSPLIGQRFFRSFGHRRLLSICCFFFFLAWIFKSFIYMLCCARMRFYWFQSKCEQLSVFEIDEAKTVRLTFVSIITLDNVILVNCFLLHRNFLFASLSLWVGKAINKFGFRAWLFIDLTDILGFYGYIYQNPPRKYRIIVETISICSFQLSIQPIILGS